jgi:hypothetical protein
VFCFFGVVLISVLEKFSGVINDEGVVYFFLCCFRIFCYDSFFGGRILVLRQF